MALHHPCTLISLEIFGACKGINKDVTRTGNEFNCWRIESNDQIDLEIDFVIKVERSWGLRHNMLPIETIPQEDITCIESQGKLTKISTRIEQTNCSRCWICVTTMGNWSHNDACSDFTSCISHTNLFGW